MSMVPLPPGRTIPPPRNLPPTPRRARKVSEPIAPTDYGEVELALVRFIGRLFKYARLDNEAIDKLSPDPDPNPYPPEEALGRARIQSLWGKLPPRIYAGTIPLSITGEIDPDAIPDYPAIVVSVMTGEYTFDLGLLEVQILAGIWDQSPERAGRLDVLNIMSALRTAFFQFPDIGGGPILARKDQGGPLGWRIVPSAWPHFFALMTVSFQDATPEPLTTRNPFYDVPDP